jgi:hypothetical protein
MFYVGEMKNGVVVVEGGIPLPEGTRVRVVALEPEPEPSLVVDQPLAWAGKGKDLPKDLAQNPG